MLRGVDWDRRIRERSGHWARRYDGECLSDGRSKTVEQRRGQCSRQRRMSGFELTVLRSNRRTADARGEDSGRPLSVRTSDLRDRRFSWIAN